MHNAYVYAYILSEGKCDEKKTHCRRYSGNDIQR